MSIKSLLYFLIIIFFVGQNSYAQVSSEKNTKEEQKYHNKQNSKFVSQVTSIQEQIQSIRQDRSLSEGEKRTKIKPLFDEMKKLRAANVADRQWQDKEEKMASTEKVTSTEKVATNKEPKNPSKYARKKIKRLQKEINRIKKDGSLTEAEKRAKLDPIFKEMMALKTGKQMSKDVATAPEGRILKSGPAKADAEEGAQEKWKADRAAERKAKMDKELGARKAKREKAREKREKNIATWKAKAREEKDTMEATTKTPKRPNAKKTIGAMSAAKPKPKGSAKVRQTDIAVAKPKPDRAKPAKTAAAKPKAESKTMADTKTSKIMKHDPLAVSDEPITSSSNQKKASSSRMMQRLKSMSDRLIVLKEKGAINPVHFERKMAHIRKVRERFLKP